MKKVSIVIYYYINFCWWPKSGGDFDMMYPPVLNVGGMSPPSPPYVTPLLLSTVPQYHLYAYTCKLKWDCGTNLSTSHPTVPQYHSTTVPQKHSST